MLNKNETKRKESRRLRKTYRSTLTGGRKSPSLGITFQDKSNSIILLCREECGFECRNNTKKIDKNY